MSTEKELLDAASDELTELVRNLGATDEECPNGFAVDLNSSLLGSPYWEGTGFFADRETAEGVAAILVAALDDLGEVAAEVLDSEDDEVQVDTWAYIISAERNEVEEPVVEEMYEGDSWFLSAYALPHLVSEAERVKINKVRDALKAAKAKVGAND